MLANKKNTEEEAQRVMQFETYMQNGCEVVTTLI